MAGPLYPDHMSRDDDNNGSYSSLLDRIELKEFRRKEQREKERQQRITLYIKRIVTSFAALLFIIFFPWALGHISQPLAHPPCYNFAIYWAQGIVSIFIGAFVSALCTIIIISMTRGVWSLFDLD